MHYQGFPFLMISSLPRNAPKNISMTPKYQIIQQLHVIKSSISIKQTNQTEYEFISYSFISTATSAPSNFVEIPKITIADTTGLKDGGLQFIFNSYIIKIVTLLARTPPHTIHAN